MFNLELKDKEQSAKSSRGKEEVEKTEEVGG